jgi:hypothetical protein
VISAEIYERLDLSSPTFWSPESSVESSHTRFQIEKRVLDRSPRGSTERAPIHHRFKLNHRPLNSSHAKAFSLVSCCCGRRAFLIFSFLFVVSSAFFKTRSNIGGEHQHHSAMSQNKRSHVPECFFLLCFCENFTMRARNPIRD